MCSSDLEYNKYNLKGVIHKYFDNSYLSVVSSLIKDEKVSADEVRKLLDEVERADRNKSSDKNTK